MSWTMTMNRDGVLQGKEEAGRAFRLTDAERRIITVCSDVLLPAGGAIGLSGVEAGVVGRFEQIVARVPAKTRLLLRALLALVEVSAPMAGVLGGRLTRLPRPKQERVLRGLMDHRVYLLRTAFLGLRTMLTLCYFSSDEVNSQLGCLPDLDPFHLGEVAS